MLERTLLRLAKLLLWKTIQSHPYPSEGADNYPTVQLTRSNEKYANEGQLRFKNELTNLEVQHDGPSTYWRNEPFWNSLCQLSSSHSSGLDGKTRSRAQERDGDKSRMSISLFNHLLPADAESSHPDLTLYRTGSTSHSRLSSVRGSVRSSHPSFDAAVT